MCVIILSQVYPKVVESYSTSWRSRKFKRWFKVSLSTVFNSLWITDKVKYLAQHIRDELTKVWETPSVSLFTTLIIVLFLPFDKTGISGNTSTYDTWYVLMICTHLNRLYADMDIAHIDVRTWFLNSFLTYFLDSWFFSLHLSYVVTFHS